MVNFQVVKETIDALKIDTNVEMVPSPVPVVEVGTKKSKNGIIITLTRSSTGTGTIYTTLNSQDFYVTSVTYVILKDVTCDAATAPATIAAPIGGVSTAIAALPLITLTAQQIQQTLDFNMHPLKIDKNSAITLAGTQTFTAGVFIRTAVITGYYDEVN